MKTSAQQLGSRSGAGAPRVCLGLPRAVGEPPKRLVAFEKVMLQPGEKKRVRLCIDPKATNHPLGTWDSAAQQWSTPEGNYQVMVGNSAANITLNQTVTVRKSHEHERDDDDDDDDDERSCVTRVHSIARD